MMDHSRFNRRPLIIAVAGPNGAGKTTFYESHLAHTNLEFVNADVIAFEQGIGPYEAAEVADRLRRQRLDAHESFVFETVFSDVAGDKVNFLGEAAFAGILPQVCRQGYCVRLDPRADRLSKLKVQNWRDK